jgi:hypothetical protein
MPNCAGGSLGSGRRPVLARGVVVAASGQGGVQVVIQEPPGGYLGIGGSASLGGHDAGMFAEQVVQLVPAGGALSDQVLVIQSIEVAAGLPGLVPSSAAAA